MNSDGQEIMSLGEGQSLSPKTGFCLNDSLLSLAETAIHIQ